MIAGERMSSRQLSSLDFDEEDNEVEGEIEVQELGSKRKTSSSGNVDSAIMQTSKGISDLLAAQAQQNQFVEALRQSNENNKYLRELLMKNAKAEGESEVYTREEAIIFAFEGKIEDDAENKICHEVRTGLRPFRGDWVKRWESLGRYASPKFEGLGLPQVGTIMLSPVVIKKMHDRGLDLKLAMFVNKNQDISVRAGKWRKIGEGKDAMHESFDWKEPDSAAQVADGVLNYTIALWRIWPEDWSALVLSKVLLRFKY